jgi:hypothetical protein
MACWLKGMEKGREEKQLDRVKATGDMISREPKPEKE